MINFPKGYEYNRLSIKIGLTAQDKLEKVLRRLGNFDSDKPIDIYKYKQGETPLDIIYVVRDNEHTEFTFYNYSTGYGEEHQNRYRMNYQIETKRKNSIITYKYDFIGMRNDNDEKGILVVEISCPLNEERILKVKTPEFGSMQLILEENSKEYVIGFNRSIDKSKILEKLDNIIEKLTQTKELNLEKLLEIIDNKFIDLAHVTIEGETVARVKFNNGTIIKYELNESDKKIRK